MDRVKADFNGICPLCHVYISRNKSWISKLPEPLIPRTRDGRVSSDTGLPYHADSRIIRNRYFPRRHAHTRCAVKYLRELNRESQIEESPRVLQ